MNVSEVERQVVLSSEKKTKTNTTIFRECHTRILCKSNSRFNSTHTVNNCGCGFLFFLSPVRVTWKKVVKNNCGCVIALTQLTIVAVSSSEQLWLWASLFSFYCQDHVVKGSEKTKKKWIIVTSEKSKLIKK